MREIGSYLGSEFLEHHGRDWVRLTPIEIYKISERILAVRTASMMLLGCVNGSDVKTFWLLIARHGSQRERMAQARVLQLVPSKGGYPYPFHKLRFAVSQGKMFLKLSDIIPRGAGADRHVINFGNCHLIITIAILLLATVLLPTSSTGCGGR